MDQPFVKPTTTPPATGQTPPPSVNADQAQLDAQFAGLLPHYRTTQLIFNGRRGRQILQHRIDLTQPLSIHDIKAFNVMNLKGAFAVITALNPRGQTQSDEANNAANAELEKHLGVNELWSEVAVDGMSADLAHREAGHAILAPRKQAKRLAAKFGQLAMYFFDEQGFWLVPVLATGEPELLDARF